MNMCAGKAILAMFIALSIAILPIARSFASGGKAVEASISMTAPDCDHHQDLPKHKPAKSTGGCDSMADCAFKCFTTTAVSFSSIAFLPTPYTALEPVAISDNIFPHMGNLPFRPPRV